MVIGKKGIPIWKIIQIQITKVFKNKPNENKHDFKYKLLIDSNTRLYT